MPFPEIAETWASIYSNSAALRSAIAFAHTGGLLIGGGSAIASDLGMLRALARGTEATGSELERLNRVHRLIIVSLAVVVTSGVLLTLADFDAFVQSPVFWIKMGLVLALFLNGAVMVSSSGRVSPGDSRALGRLRTITLASIALWCLTTLMGTVLPNVL